MNESQLNELLLQSLEHEKGGIRVYTTALKCVVNDDLKGEWEQYLEDTTHHVEVLTELCALMGVDPEAPSPGKTVVNMLGQSLVAAMEKALQAGPPEAAQLIACECVVFAETKDHADWELIGKCGENLGGEKGEALLAAYDDIEDEEDEHLYHSKGWCRELWFQSLGLTAVLPPPEEQKDVKSAIGAALAKQESERTR